MQISNVKKKTKTQLKTGRGLEQKFFYFKGGFIEIFLSFWTNIYLKIVVNPYSLFLYEIK